MPLLAALLLAACFDPSSARHDAPPLSAVAALSSDDVTGFARALTPRAFDFPRDHGPHEDFKTEWWYFTGNLETDAGRHFGYQLTFFRQALAPTMPARGSLWATRQLYLAHFAVSDAAGERFLAAERLGRGAAGLAGATAAPMAVWLEDWSVRAVGGTSFPARLQATTQHVSLELDLQQAKPPVLNGDGGLSQKGAAAGNASYYFSHSRLPTAGTVTIEGETFDVRGASWLDREWSTSVLEPGQVGWDWFALQLDDGRELMAYHLRRDDGRVDPQSRGTLVHADGTSQSLERDDFELEVLATWTSPRGATYPARWRLHLPVADLALEIEPWLADQELDVSFRYWEGAVRIEGTAAGRPVGGNGYAELVGYD